MQLFSHSPLFSISLPFHHIQPIPRLFSSHATTEDATLALQEALARHTPVPLHHLQQRPPLQEDLCQQTDDHDDQDHHHHHHHLRQEKEALL